MSVAAIPPSPTRVTPQRALDGALFAMAGVSALWLAWLLLQEGFAASWQALLLIPFWLLVAYLVLPRLHRVLTYLYLPDYFIGRTRTSDGLLGDPVNLALQGTEAQLAQVMDRAGWVLADPITWRSSLRIVTSTLSRRSYAEAPVSPLHLFGRPQDLAYQQEVAGSPSKRHHVRCWRCPEGWLLPGGYAVDWLAAGTYDRSVGLSLWTFQVTHRIAGDIDTERDYIVGSLTTADPVVTVERLKSFSTGYHSRNGGGDRIETDGDLPVVDLQTVDAPAPVVASVLARRPRRPAPTVFGSTVAAARGLLFLLTAVQVLVAGEGRLVPADATAPTTVLVLTYLTAAVLDLGLATATFAGRNWARVVLMLESVVAILEALLLEESKGRRPTLGTSLPAVALSILVLLALTSRASRDYAEWRSGPQS